MLAFEIRRWLELLPPQAEVSICDGGMSLVAPKISAENGGPAYLEVGGLPDDGLDISAPGTWPDPAAGKPSDVAEACAHSPSLIRALQGMED